MYFNITRTVSALYLTSLLQGMKSIKPTVAPLLNTGDNGDINLSYAKLLRNKDQRLITDLKWMIQHEQIAIIIHMQLQYRIYFNSLWMWTFGFPKLVALTQGWHYGGWTWHGWTRHHTTRTIPPNSMAMLYVVCSFLLKPTLAWLMQGICLT